MPTCKQCQQPFPNWVEINGKNCNLNKRVFCLACSPFGAHNTRSLRAKLSIHQCAHCGESDPNKFSKTKFHIRRKCHTKYTTQNGVNNKAYTRDILGNKCVLCGFDKYPVALDVHHLDPSKKDPNFKSMRGWSRERIQAEIKSCILLCRNCHAALHAGLVSLIGV